MLNTLVLDSDSIEVEGLRSDAHYNRAMRMGSLRLRRAIERAQGMHDDLQAPKPKPAYLPVPQRVAFVPGEGLGKGIMRAVATAYGMTVTELLSRKRTPRYVMARAVVAMLLRNLRWEDGTFRFSLPQIGRMMGRDHSTICHALDMFEIYYRTNPFVRAVFEQLKDGEK